MSYVCEFESLCQPTVDISRTPLPIGCPSRFRETGGDMLKDMLDWTGSLVFCQVELSKGPLLSEHRQHHGHKAHPLREVGLRPLEHRAGQRVVPRTARPAEPPLRPGRRPTVAERPPAVAAARAPRGGPERLGHLLEGAPSVRVPAGPGLDRGRQKREVCRRRAR